MFSWCFTVFKSSWYFFSIILESFTVRRPSLCFVFLFFGLGKEPRTLSILEMCSTNKPYPLGLLYAFSFKCLYMLKTLRDRWPKLIRRTNFHRTQEKWKETSGLYRMDCSRCLWLEEQSSRRQLHRRPSRWSKFGGDLVLRNEVKILVSLYKKSTPNGIPTWSGVKEINAA